MRRDIVRILTAVLFVRSVDTVHDAVTYCLVTDTFAIVTQETGTFGCGGREYLSNST